MSSILSRFTRVSLTNLATHRSTSPSSSHPLCLVQHVKWCHDKSHHNHGIPGIPNDGRVVLHRNSKTGSQVYLIGTTHGTQQSYETVKKVINAVRPDAVAIELCMTRALDLSRWKTLEKWGLVRILFYAMKFPGCLKTKINTFFTIRQQLANLIHNEFLVAMEEAHKVKAKLFVIDQDFQIITKKLHWLDQVAKAKQAKQQLPSLFVPKKNIYQRLKDFKKRVFPERAFAQAPIEVRKLPEFDNLIIHEQDVLMCAKLRRLEHKLIVAVVGRGHLDGIGQLWKRAENPTPKKRRSERHW